MDLYLKCPACGQGNLHHTDVRVCNRSSEDAAGIRVDIHGLTVTTTANVADDKSFAGRRSDLRIRFTCEQCPKESWLYVIQHKGDTIMKWLEAGDGSVYDKSIAPIESSQ